MTVLADLRRDSSGQAVAAGVSASLLGYASSVTVVVTGLVQVGATSEQVRSALLVLGVVMGVTTVGLSGALRIPVAVVWSTPAVALLAGLGAVEGGYPAVLGAFAVAGVAIALTGVLPGASQAVSRLPPALTAAVLAGVLLPFCLAPVRAAADLPLQAGAIVLAWALATRFAPRWAAPVSLLALVAVVLVDGGDGLSAGPPVLVPVAPTLTWAAVAQVAVPVYVVTMAAQNLVGAAVLRSSGYDPRLRPVLVTTGLASAASAPFGAPTQNLAAITGALTAGPTAHDDPARRWVAAVASGGVHVLLGLLAPLTAALATDVDPRLVATAAGLALLPTLAASTEQALRDDRTRLAAVVVLVVTASGVSAGPLGAAALGLLAGGALLLLHRR